MSAPPPATPRSSGQPALESLQALVDLTNALKRADSPEQVYQEALDCLPRSLGVSRAAILLFDPDGVPRFKAWRGISEQYRSVVEGHSPWTPDHRDPRPILVPDTSSDPDLAALRPALAAEGIGALAFIPLIYRDRLVGKFMLYYDQPHDFPVEEVELASAIASYVAFATERRRAEAERAELLVRAREVETRYRALFAGLADAVLVCDADGRYLDVNPAAEALLGYDRDTLLGMRIADITEWPAERAGQEFEELRSRREWRGELVLRRRDGSRVPVEARARAVQVPGGVVYLSVVRDISARQRAETELQRSEGRFRRLFESNMIGIAFWSFGGQVVEANDAFLRLIGYDREDVAAGRVSWRAMTPEEYRVLDDTAIEQVKKSGVAVPFEKEYVRKDGSRIPLLIGAARLEAEQSDAVKFAIDLTEQKRAAQEIARLYDEAQRANLAKDEFLATASHELRTPLNAILGWASLLRSHQVPPAGAERALETIERNARTQARLIDEILDVSRIITGKLRLDRKELDLDAVVKAATETVRPAAEARSITIEEALVGDPLILVGDPMRLQQVVWNLLSNAIKFTPEGGRVSVVLERRPSGARLRVRDTGLGISPEFIPHVFERFRQADSSTTRQHGGLGLGLAIVRHLVELHGGTVAAASNGLGQGATFTVDLPLAGAPVVSPEPSVKVEGSRSAALQSVSLKGLRVLVVEDEPDSLELVRTMLEVADARVIAFGSAAEALELLEGGVPGSPPDVLVSDIAMPGQDGFELIARLRALPRPLGGIPAIALTAYAGAVNRSRLLSAGFQGHLEKPVVATELTLLVARLSGR